MRLTFRSAALLSMAAIAVSIVPLSALAQDPVPVPTATQPQPPPAYTAPALPSPVVPVKEAQGIAVLGTAGARDEAFTVGRALYASRLRPSSLDDARAKILAGDPAKEDAPKDLKELAELRAGVSGEDAASKRLLAGIAKDLNVEAILVVSKSADSDAGASAPVARLFLAEGGEIDAARYVPEPGVEGSVAWRATVSSLERRFAKEVAPVAATKPLPPPASEPSPFYKSGWFWGAVGAAALAGGAFYFLSRDTSTDTIHLQMNVPR